MKFLIVLCLVAAACADVSLLKHPEQHAQILRQTQVDSDVHGNYKFAFDTENKISAQEVGSFKETQKGEVGPAVVTGESSYIAPGGQKITLTYVADENGFRAQGDHIPAIPEYILRSLEFIRQQEAKSGPKKF